MSELEDEAWNELARAEEQAEEKELRDEFAKAALPGVFIHYDTTEVGLQRAVDAAYRVADFMLKRRNRK